MAKRESRQSVDWSGLTRSYGWLVATVVVFAGLLAVDIVVTSRDDATEFENGLVSFIFFAAGVIFSFYSGRQFARIALKRDGQKSVRRILNLVGGMQGLSIAIDQEREYTRAIGGGDDAGNVSIGHVDHTFDVLQREIARELTTVADALEDWRDIVPEAVEDVERRADASQESL